MTVGGRPSHRQAEGPCVDEISDIDRRRSSALLPLLLLAALVLCPLPSAGGSSTTDFADAALRSDIW